MNWKKYSVCVISIFIFTNSFLPVANSGIWDPFHTKKEKIDMWKTLWDSTSNTEYKSIGKTYNDNDIWLFSVGNPDGGKILLDGEIHGNEDKGSETLFLLAQWLLKSDDLRAHEIMAKNQVMFLPILNYDRDARGNANYEISTYGVDLNRNFAGGWQKLSPNSDTYSGAYPYSEPETIVLRDLLNNSRPDFYVNMHVGTGPFLAYHRDGDIMLAGKIIADMRAEAFELGIEPYRAHGIGSQGYSLSEATRFGVSGWVLEMEGSETAWRHSDEIYQDLTTIYFPKVLAMFLAMTKSCQVEDGMLGDFDGDCDVDFLDLIGFVVAYHEFTINGKWNIAADFDYDEDIDLIDFRAFLRSYRREVL